MSSAAINGFVILNYLHMEENNTFTATNFIKSQQGQDMHHTVSHEQQNTQHVAQQLDHATNYEW